MKPNEISELSVFKGLTFDTVHSRSANLACAQVGWDMKARAGQKAVVLELGGNAAGILEDYRDDQELEGIIKKLVYGAFYQSGQSCISLQRLFIRQVGIHTTVNFTRQ
jgi:hypothetical protein